MEYPAFTDLPVYDATFKDLGELAEWKTEAASLDHCGTFIDHSCIIRDTDGQPLVVYLELPPKLTRDLRHHLRNIEYPKVTYRTGGMAASSRIFGYKPRIAVRDDWCSATRLAIEDPVRHQALVDAAQLVEHYYERHNPGRHRIHAEEVDRVLPEWRMEKSVFTSGIVNHNTALPYHHDAGNFSGVWSAMFTFKHAVAGGHLACPEIDTAFELKDGSLLLFDGQGLLHGVTDMRLRSPDAYRLTVVYYSLKGMWQCLPPDEEVERIQHVRTERERKRAAGD